MARKEFNIKYRPQIESGEYKVETRNGKEVRITCWDAVNASYDNIVALVKSNISGNENIYRYYTNGHLVSDSANIGDKDLIIITQEPELSEFEKCIGFAIGFSINDMEENREGVIKHIKDTSSELLSIAKKELKVELESRVKDAFYRGLEKGKERGKAEALKDLPRWERSHKPHLSTEVKNYALDGYDAELWLLHRGKKINIKSLEKLLGFKED